MISLALRLDLWLLWVYKPDSRPALTGLGTSGDLRFDLKVGYVIQEEGSRLLSLIPGSSNTGFGIWTSRLDLKPSLAWVLQPCHVILERCFTPVCMYPHRLLRSVCALGSENKGCRRVCRNHGPSGSSLCVGSIIWNLLLASKKITSTE